MATHRYIQTCFWSDPFTLGLSPEEKYFYAYLLTNPHTRQCGAYEIPPQFMQLETGYNQDTLSKLISRFKAYKRIEFDDDNNEVFVVNWLKYNCPDSQPVIKCIVRELSTIKTIDFKRKIIDILHKKGFARDTPSIPPTGHPIKELKELNLKELKEKGSQDATLAWEQRKENLTSTALDNLPTSTTKKKKLTPAEIEAERTALVAMIEECASTGKDKLADELRAQLLALQ